MKAHLKKAKKPNMANKGGKQSKTYIQHIIASASIILLAVMFVFALMLFTDVVVFDFAQEPGEEVSQKQDPIVRHPLTGAWLYEELDEFPFVYAVVVENHYDARPQSGLEEAFLVYEAPVEAGISRMLAFYYEGQEVKEIGPVRSARPYFVDWAQMFDAMFVHVGGSPQALEQIKEDGTYDLNEYWYGGTYFWRSEDREAPHNTYTSTELLAQAQEEMGYKEFFYNTWEFKDPIELTEDPVDILIDFSIYDWNNVQWIFDTEIGRYERYDGNAVHTTMSGESIFADNVIVIETKVELIDDVGRRSIEVLGSGDAYVLQDGRLIVCEWNRDTLDQRLVLIKDGEPVAMNAGKTWVQVVPTLDDVTIL
jgi:hypothetical protein